MFGKRKNTCAEAEIEQNSAGETNAVETAVHDRPRICLIDIEKPVAEALRSRSFNCYSGTLGCLVEVPNRSYRDEHRCLINCDWPSNLHEYDVFIVDLQNVVRTPYIEKKHTRSTSKGHKQYIFASSFPETLFDPRGFSAWLLESDLRTFLEKKSILVVFAATYEKIEYHGIAVTK